MRLKLSAALGVSFGLLLSAQAWAQSTGTIAGSVKDTTGAVLPGVTVEAASPALIEKTRTTVTDGQGRYSITDLRPGTYTVTFTLPSFATFKREGLELTTGFTANVNAEMRVGAVEETVTVTGASPVVDVQNVRQQTVLTREVWDALPTGKTLQSYVALTLGAQLAPSSQDVGGSRGDRTGGGFDYHGAGQNDSAVVIDGMTVNTQSAGGGPWTRTTHNNQMAIEETTIGMGVSAEQANAGVQINMIPKEGSNKFAGTFAINGSTTKLQSDNLTPALVARGIPVQGKVQKLYDAGGGMGGPILKDRLWFFAADRWWNAENIVVGAFPNATPEPRYGLIPIYTPDVSRPSISGAPHHNDNLRLTWQAARAHKLSFFTEIQSSCVCYRTVSSSRAPEASEHLSNPYGAINVLQGRWTYVQGNRWLFSVGHSSYISSGKGGTKRPDQTSLTAIPMRDLTTGFFWNGTGDDPFPFGTCCMPFDDHKINSFSYSHDENYTATYAAGTHTFKIGGQTNWFGSAGGTGGYNKTPLGPVVLSVRGGVNGVVPVPASVLYLLDPLGPASADSNRGAKRVLVTALFAQEQWSLGRLTLSLGARYDGMHGKYDAYTTAASNLIPSQTLPGVEDVPDWKDIAPRLGAAYDLFGNGKTAIKGSWGRFVQKETDFGPSPGSRLGYGGGSRTWNDSFYPAGDARRGNFAPDCDFRNPLANGECGTMTNTSRGLATAQSTFYDPSISTGWGSRVHLWNSSLSVQHELSPGVGLTVGYFRTSYGSLQITDNRTVSPTDYNEYCVTAPTDAALGSASGSRICGLFDLNPSKFGQPSNNLVTRASNFGDLTDVTNSIDISVNARLKRGGVLNGGVSTGQSVRDRCFVVDSPNALRFCRTSAPWAAQTQVKLSGSYPLPWDFRVSGTFQNLAGPTYGANLTFTSAQIAPSLGRPLSSGTTGTVSVPLVEPNTLYEPRFNQLDLRFAKTIRVGDARFQGQFDAYNVFNSSAVTALSSTYGSLWRRPSSVLGARLFKFGFQVDWR